MTSISILLLVFSFITGNVFARDRLIPFTIYHTNDLHSHFEGVKYPSYNGTKSFEIRGSYDRLSTVINNLRKEKEKAHEIILGVDAGDFFAGTIFSSLAPSQEASFPEFEFFEEHLFDVITLGNHEFDASNVGLERMLNKIISSNKTTQLVATNLLIKNNQSPLKAMVGNDRLIKNFIVKDFTNGKDRLRIGFLGLLGPDACLVSKSTRGDVEFIGFNDKKSKAKIDELVDFFNQKIVELRRDHKVDVVVISMHGGGQEAYDIIKKLRNVDIILAGHTHEVENKIIDGKILSQTGSYGEHLGVLELNFNMISKEVTLRDPARQMLISVNEKILPNKKWSKKIAGWKRKAIILMGDNPRAMEAVVFRPDRNFERHSKIQDELGRMVSTRILSEMNREGLKIDIYFTTMGLIRTSLFKDMPYTGSDLFELVGIGFDDQLVPGVNTVSFYLSIEEVERLVDFLEFYSRVSSNFSPVFSNNLTFETREFGIPFFNRIKKLKLNGKDLSAEKRLIKLATNQFVIKNLSMIESATYGLVKIRPKNEQGNPISTYPLYKKEYQFLIQGFGH